MTGRRLVAIALLLMPAGAWAGTVTEGGFTFVEQSGGALYRAARVGGTVANRYDIAVLGDGFTAGEQEVFDAAVDEIITELFTIPPYDERKCAFNIWVVNLVSNDSGIDEGSTQRDTPLDCKREVAGEPDSYVTGNFEKCRQVCDVAKVPSYDAIYVLVNSTEYGAYSYPSAAIAFTTRRNYAGWFLAHELAHVIAELGDEYTCRLCDGSDSGRIYYGSDPEAPNLTTVLNAATVKWKDLIAYPSDPVPTTPEITCNCGDVGLWVGGGYYAYGIYRPAEYCLMDGVMCPQNDPFCKVCARAIGDELIQCSGFMIDTVLVGTYAQMNEMRDVERLSWQNNTLVARRMAYCYRCEPGPDPRLAAIVVEIPHPRDGALVVLDDLHGKAATGTASDGVLRATFVMNPARTYYALIDPGPPTADVLTLRARMTIDGNPVNLRR